MNTLAPPKPSLQWNAEAVERILLAAGIPTRYVLAERLGEFEISHSSVYRAFEYDWSGDVSIPVLAGLMRLLGASVNELVTL